MANIYDAVFLLQLLIAVGIIFTKIWNTLNAGTIYDWKTGMMLFIGYLLCWFAGMVVLLQKNDIMIYGTFYNLEVKLLYFVGLFTFIEIIFMLKDSALNPFKRSA